MNIKIAFFSGTGCTRHVALTLSEAFNNRGVKTSLHDIRYGASHDSNSFDMLILCFVVHAANAPLPVLKWLKDTHSGNGRKAVIISVSGGGEVTPNLACRVDSKRILKQKGYEPVYETMIGMPSNWMVATPKNTALKLIQLLPDKMNHLVKEILGGHKQIIRAPLGNRLIKNLASLEHLYGKFFGRGIKVKDSCIECGKCIKECPANNIANVNGRPVFGNKCLICLNCLYACPVKALEPGRGKFVLIKEGFDLKKILECREEATDSSIKKETKGILWLGIRKYLKSQG